MESTVMAVESTVTVSTTIVSTLTESFVTVVLVVLPPQDAKQHIVTKTAKLKIAFSFFYLYYLLLFKLIHHSLILSNVPFHCYV